MSHKRPIHNSLEFTPAVLSNLSRTSPKAIEIYTYYKLISNSYGKFLDDYKLSANDYLRFQPAILADQLALSGKTLLNLEKHPRIQALISMMNNEIDSKIGGFVYDYPNKNKPF